MVLALVFSLEALLQTPNVTDDLDRSNGVSTRSEVISICLDNGSGDKAYGSGDGLSVRLRSCDRK